jgi:hypothetical protein
MGATIVNIDVQQVIYALERAAALQEGQAQRLLEACDYSAEFWAEDAERLREAITLLRPLLQVEQPQASHTTSHTSDE